MKKFFVLMVVMAVTAVMPASAQGVKFGVKGGLNNTEMKFDESVFDAENRLVPLSGSTYPSRGWVLTLLAFTIKGRRR